MKIEKSGVNSNSHQHTIQDQLASTSNTKPKSC